MAIVGLSVVSLATETRASFIGDGIRTVVSVLAHPVWLTLDTAKGTSAFVASAVRSQQDIRAENHLLRQRVNSLQTQLANRDEVLAQNARLRDLLAFRDAAPGLTFLVAPVFTSYEKTLQVGRGEFHGVQPLAGVLSPSGVVGIVSKVEPFSSYVVTLHHANCSIMAVIKRNRIHGVVVGSDFKRSHICEMRYIDAREEILVGDEVVTMGGDGFPSGRVIGHVTEVPYVEGSLFRTAYIQPAADISTLDEVVIVMKAPVSEEELRGTVTAPVNASNAPPVPDDRSLQERFAP